MLRDIFLSVVIAVNCEYAHKQNVDVKWTQSEEFFKSISFLQSAMIFFIFPVSSAELYYAS